MADLPSLPLKPVQPQFSTSRAVMALVLREMSTTYGRSPGGYLWAILEPALGISLLVLVFSAGFKSPPLGTSFALFYASGMLAFMMFNDISAKMGQALQFSRQLLEYPRVTYLDAMFARLLLNVITHLMVHAIVIGFVILALETNTKVDVLKVLKGYLMVISLGAGIGALNGFLTLAYPLWQNIWSIIMRPLFFISCIIFLFESVPSPYDGILWYNPLVHVIGQMRDGYYPFYEPDYVSLVYIMLVSFSSGCVGLFLQRRYHQDMLLK